MDEITLDEFMVQFRAQVDKFEKDWKEGQRTQPDQFPVTMPVADWWQQAVEGFMN